MNSNHYWQCYEFVSSKTVQWKELAKELGYESGEALRGQFRRERDRRAKLEASGEANKIGQDEIAVGNVGLDGETSERERTSYRETDEGLYVVCDSKRIKTKDDVIEHFNIDLDVWEVREFTVRTSEGYRKDRKVSWQNEGGISSGYVEDSGKIVVVPMIHTETKFARKKGGVTLEDVDKFFNRLDPVVTLKAPEIIREKSSDESGLVLEINFADLHVGNNPVDASMTVAEKVMHIVSDIKDRSRNLNIRKILLVQLGDVYHFDTFNQTTTSGTRIETGMSFPSMFDEGANIMINAINELAKIAPVEMVNIVGNHDRIASYTLGKALEFYYRNSSQVTIDAGHSERKFRKIGNNLIFWAHGDMPKKNLYSLIQREARREYGETLYAEIHVGHLHHQQTIEENGVIIRFLPSTAYTDGWHKKEGYTGALRAVSCFLWDAERGLRDIWFSGV